MRRSGERLVLLLGPDGLGDRSGCVYGSVCLRTRSGSFNTVLHAMRGVAVLRRFLDARGIDWPSRVASARFLAPGEWQDFAAEVGAGVAVETRVARLVAAAKYMAWTVRCHAGAIHDTASAAVYRDRARDFLAGCGEAIPPAGGGGGRRDGLSREQRRLLAAVLRDPAELARLWPGPDPFARSRNALALLWLLLLGHRSGELLAMWVGDLAPSAEEPWLEVVRRHDSPVDPRPLQPSVKGLGRRLDVPSELLPALLRYLAARAAIPLAHPFLLVSRCGAPLSRSALAAAFARLGEVHPTLAGATPHTLRHTWVGVFRDAARRLGVRAEDASWIEARAMGWRDEASDRFYADGQRREQADAVSARMQSMIMGGEDDGDHG